MGSPDGELIQQIRDACDWWQGTGDGPTSSITGGGAIVYLETAFSTLMGGRPALAMPSGMAALQLALAAVGVEPGDDVVCPAYDWSAATCAVRALGARPILADVTPSSLTIDASAVKRRLTRTTKAVVATHLFGIPADVPELRRFTDRAGIPVVEDAAQGLGSSIRDTPVGALGAAAAFSFGPGKIIEAGEGGMLVTHDADTYSRAVSLSQHPTRQLLEGIEETHQTRFSARMSGGTAIMAAYALRSLPARLATRRDQFEAVSEAAQRIGYQLLGVDQTRQPNHWRIPIRLLASNSRHGDDVILAKPVAQWLAAEATPSFIRTTRTAHVASPCRSVAR